MQDGILWSMQARNSSQGRHRRRFVKPLSIVCGIALIVVGVFASLASAHSGDQSYLYVDVSESALGGRIETPIADLWVALGIDAPADKETAFPLLQQNEAAIQAYFEEHLGFSNDGNQWPVSFGEIELFFSEETEVDDNYLVIPFEADVGETVPRRFDLTFDPYLDEMPGRNHLLLIANDWQAGVFDNGWESLVTFDEGGRTQNVDLGETSWLKNVWSSMKLGIDHIKTGPDHVLFVLVLLLPSVLIFRDKWRPTTGFVSSLWRVLKIVTMFTVAHSITFTLAGLDLLPLPPSKLVEAIIAVSIAAAAVHNIRPIFPNKEWLISFVFGLFHGMGFASLVEGLDVSRSTQLLSLLGRNIGIEIGQAAVVVLLFPALFMLRRTRFYRPFFIGASILMALVALVWMWERLFETDLGIDAIIDPIFAWPRVLIGIGVFTALAVAAFFMERKNGRLEPVADSPAIVEQQPVGV